MRPKRAAAALKGLVGGRKIRQIQPAHQWNCRDMLRVKHTPSFEEAVPFQPKVRFGHGQRPSRRKGSINEVVGKAAGDAKLEAEGKADKVEGKVQNAVGGLKASFKSTASTRLGATSQRE